MSKTTVRLEYDNDLVQAHTDLNVAVLIIMFEYM